MAAFFSSAASRTRSRWIPFHQLAALFTTLGVIACLVEIGYISDQPGHFCLLELTETALADGFCGHSGVNDAPGQELVTGTCLRGAGLFPGVV